MGANTKIEWAHHTFNPWVGCTKVSDACDHCYAEGWAKRTGQASLWQGDRRRTAPANWRAPIRWDAAAQAAGERHRVFCASLADVFDNQVPERWRDDLWHRIDQTPNLDWLLLTKRPQNIRKMLPGPKIGAPEWCQGWPNVWLGTTAENQEEADRCIPHLLAVPAALRFLSCEPLLGPIDLARIPFLAGDLRHKQDALTGQALLYGEGIDGHPDITVRMEEPHTRPLDWIIAGGESGAKARPMHPDWARSLRDQCCDAAVPFFFKQWGEWLTTAGIGPNVPPSVKVTPAWMREDGFIRTGTIPFSSTDSDPELTETGRSLHHRWIKCARVGKGNAGRLLDGIEHNAFPSRVDDALERIRKDVEARKARAEHR